MIGRLVAIGRRVIAALDGLRWAWLLAARLGVGLEFFLSGKGKLARLPEIIAYFRKLGIPAPGIQAPFIASLECFGGLCLILGLATRLFGFLLGCTMVVAIATAVDFAGKGVADFLYLSEWLLLVLLWGFVFSGAGPVSIDRVLARRAARAD